MQKFIISLGVLLIAFVPMSMAQTQAAVCSTNTMNGTSAGYTALCTLANWSAPTIQALAILLLIMGILAAGFELFKRSIGWAIGLFVGASVIFAVLWGISTPVKNVLTDIANVIEVNTITTNTQ